MAPIGVLHEARASEVRGGWPGPKATIKRPPFSRRRACPFCARGETSEGAATRNGYWGWSGWVSAAARPQLEESRTLFKDLGDVWGEAFTLYLLGMAAYFSGDRAAARAYYEESLPLFQEQGDVFGVILLVSALEAVVLPQGDEETARSLYEQSLPLLRASKDRGRLGMILINVGDAWLHNYGDEQQGKMLYKQGLNLWQEMQRVDNGLGIVRGLAGLAEVAAAQGQAERAGRLFGAAARLLPSASLYREEVNRRVAAARAQLDATAFTTGWTAGQTMTEEQAVTDALQEA
jgi:tetratricopeptide (TPR) repeat protein